MTVIDRRYSVAEGTAIKAPCRVATTANITLAGAQTIDGVAVTETNPPTRVLVKDQTNQTQNGIYDVSTGNWTRARDFDGAYDIVLGTRVFVTGGTVNDYEEFIVTTADPIVVGTSNITFGLGTASAAGAAAIAAAAAAAASATAAGTAETNAETAQAAAEAAQAAAEVAVATAYYVNSATYGAVGDAQFTYTASIVSGTDDLTDSASPFVPGDVGKTICIAGAGVAGAVLVTTITAYVGTGAVTIGTNASTTVASANIQWGTDNTTAFNNAIAALTKGGAVYTPCGVYLATSIDLTGTSSVKFCGAAQGVNNFVRDEVGTVIVPINGDYPLLDLTASTGIWIQDIQLGWSISPVTGLVGILAANSTTVAVDTYEIRNVFITHKWSIAALYAFGAPGRIWSCRIWNYTPETFAAVFTRSNHFGITSQYQTIATAVNNAQWACYESEFHNFNGGATTGSAVYLRGIIGISFYGCSFDSSTTALGTLFAQIDTATDCTMMAIGCNFYSESATPSQYSYYCGDTLQIAGFNNTYTFGTAKKGGGGTFNFTAVETV